MWLVAKQIVKETEDTEEQRFINIINLDHIKRIALVKGKNEADVYFNTPTVVIKNDQFEDYINIEVLDKKMFVEKFKDIISIV
jgi:hypothetical protein